MLFFEMVSQVFMYTDFFFLCFKKVPVQFCSSWILKATCVGVWSVYSTLLTPLSLSRATAKRPFSCRPQ